MVESLGDRLVAALPDHVTFQRGRLSRRLALAVDLGALRFRLELTGQRPETWTDHIVRDVCVRSDEIDLDAWLAALADALEQEAERSVTVRLALQEALS